MSKPLLFAFCILSCEIARSYCTAFSSKHTDIQNFPHHVSLRRDGQHVCSGAIVSASYILTAASCIYDPYPTLNASRYTILMGSAKLVDPPSNAIILPVLELIPNPNFHHYTLFCDLALVKVDALEFLMSDKSVARPLFLPETKFYEVNDDQLLKTTGWQKLLDGTGKFDPQLSVTGAKIVNSSYCIKGMLPYHTYSYRKLCAGYTLENQ